MFGQTDWVTIIDLLLRGDWTGRAAVLIGLAVPSALSWFTARRFYVVRSTTHALMGGEGRFAAQGPRDVEGLFSTLKRRETALVGAQNASEDRGLKTERAAWQVVDECRELDRLNLAFRTNLDRQAYLDRIKDARCRANQALRSVRQTVREVA